MVPIQYYLTASVISSHVYPNINSTNTTVKVREIERHISSSSSSSSNHMKTSSRSLVTISHPSATTIPKGEEEGEEEDCYDEYSDATFNSCESSSNSSSSRSRKKNYSRFGHHRITSDRRPTTTGATTTSYYIQEGTTQGLAEEVRRLQEKSDAVLQHRS